MARSQTWQVAAAVILVFGSVAHGARQLTSTGYCPHTTCPTGYVPTIATYPDGTKPLCPQCYRPANLACPLVYSSDGLPVGNPRCCGGADGTICPSIACTTSTSYAIAPVGGCARAQSSVSAFSFNSATYTTLYGYKEEFKKYCADTVNNSLEAAISILTESYAEACAKTLLQYNVFACDCARCATGTTCSANATAAYSSISGTVQAMARAQAYAFTEAIASVEADCFNGEPALLSFAYASAESFASSVETAIDSLYKSASSKSSATACKTTLSGDSVKTAVARAVACTFATVFASAKDACTPGDAFSCSGTISLAGSAAIQGYTCPVSIPCAK